MSRIVHKINFLLEDDVRRELEDLVLLANRNQVANEALRKELELLRRQQATIPLSPDDLVRTSSYRNMGRHRIAS
jgi:hypothetical protein